MPSVGWSRLARRCLQATRTTLRVDAPADFTDTTYLPLAAKRILSFATPALFAFVFVTWTVLPLDFTVHVALAFEGTRDTTNFLRAPDATFDGPFNKGITATEYLHVAEAVLPARSAPFSVVVNRPTFLVPTRVDTVGAAGPERASPTSALTVPDPRNGSLAGRHVTTGGVISIPNSTLAGPVLPLRSFAEQLTVYRPSPVTDQLCPAVVVLSPVTGCVDAPVHTRSVTTRLSLADAAAETTGVRNHPPLTPTFTSGASQSPAVTASTASMRPAPAPSTGALPTGRPLAFSAFFTPSGERHRWPCNISAATAAACGAAAEVP